MKFLGCGYFMNMPSNTVRNTIFKSEISNHFDRVKIWVFV